MDSKVTINEKLTINNAVKLDAKGSKLNDLEIKADNVKISNAEIDGQLNIEGKNAVIENTKVTVESNSKHNGQNVITIKEGSEGATLKNVTAKNGGSQGAALSIECDNVTIEDGDFEIENEALQGQGAIRVGAEKEIKHFKVIGATLKGGIHVLKYTGKPEDLVITDNNITLDKKSGGGLSGIIIRISDVSDVAGLASKLAYSNTFHISDKENYKVLIHNTSDWTIKASVK